MKKFYKPILAGEGKWFAGSFANLSIIFVPLSFHWF